ncbi:MAG TPA: hypothetical protein VMU84_05695 [Thermoanaerobaculia bacterium]|nr:hypothetical protein [Thermoanaerobaculia bacterium]
MAALFVPVVALATHVPGSSEVITYDGTLAPGTPATGTIGWQAPSDGYDWYCFDVTTGTPVSLTITRTSGDIFPNLGVMRGLAEVGGTASLPIVTESSNSTETNATLTFTPDFSGPVTMWVSTFLGELNGGFSVTMTGGTGRAACSSVVTPTGPQISVEVPGEVFLTGISSITVPITVKTAAGFDNDVALNATGLPDDVQLTFSKPVIPKPGSDIVNLTIKTGSNTFPANYSLLVVATGGEATASNSFPVTVYCDPPLILATNQPKSQTVTRGSVARLETASTGTGPFKYQWFAGNTGQTRFPLAGGTDKTFTTSGINDVSYYWVRVSNACGSADSQTATVTPIGSVAPKKKR